MNETLTQLGSMGLVPVIAIDSADDAVPLAEALEAGGLPVAEVTFRTAAGRESIQRIARRRPAILLGAGTVLTVEQVKEAVDAGARYIVSPGLNRKVVEYCLAQGVPITPGVVTPSEVEVALEYGLEVVKFFPAEASGGLNYLRAISAPYHSLKFIPTGGIEERNLLSYLSFPPIHACGGSWMVKKELIASKQFEEIRRITTRAVDLVLGFELKHVGINLASEEESLSLAGMLASIVRQPVKEGNSSNFVGTGFELLKRQGQGTHGHLALGTNSIPRAIAHLERRGIKVRPETAVEKDGRVVSVYLKDEIGGFALHLLQK